MFASGLNQTKKVPNTHTNPSEIETRSTVFRSTLSSRAKQATCNKSPAAVGTGTNNTNTRGVLKSKFTDLMPITRKPIPSLTEHIPLSKKPTFSLTDRIPLINNTNVRSVKSSRTSSSTDTVTSKASTNVRKDFKRDADNKFVPSQAPINKRPKNLAISGSSNRSRTPCTARSAVTKETDGINPRLWKRNKTCSTLVLSKNPYNESREGSENHEILTQPIDTGVQTNEKEILNHSLLVGDIKFLRPSQDIVYEIEKQRKDLKTKQLLKATRKFEAHSEKQEEHLNDLKEFLEKSYVTKKLRKPRDSTEEEQKLFSSMDQFFNRDLPKTESITDIKSRIKRKEQELLNLFDNVQTSGRLANKIN